MVRTTVANYIYRYLVQKNIKYVFGYSGGAVLPLLNEFYDSKHIQFIKNSNEQCSGFVAEGYSKSLYLAVPGVIITTSGPGVTNLITPLQNAKSDGTPLIAISAQVPRKAIGTDAFQECDAINLTKHCTKWNKLVLNADHIPQLLDMAYNISMTARKGPVHLDIPKDVLLQEIEYERMDIIYNRHIEYIGLNLHHKIKKLSEYIEKSDMPIIIAGQGCNNCSDELNEFATKNNIPVTTTIHGMGSFDETNELSLEMLGMHGNPSANHAVQEADLIIALGTRFDDRTTGNLKNYGLKAKNIIYIDNSFKQITKVMTLFDIYRKPIKSLQCDVKLFLKYLLADEFKKKDTEWIKTIKKNNRYSTYYYNENMNLKAPDVIKSINYNIDYLEMDRKDIIFTTGVGNHQMWTAQHITWTHPGKIITSGSLGTMGVGVPFAIGSKFANQNSTIICIDGDSSFCMTSSELLTVLENKIPIKIAIMNDGKQQMVHIWQKLFHDERYIGTDNINPDFGVLAEAYNIDTIECYSKVNLDNCVKKFLRYEKPVIGIFNIEPEMCYPLVSPGKALNHMIEDENDIANINVKMPAPN